jgi:hypothetical protein
VVASFDGGFMFVSRQANANKCIASLFACTRHVQICANVQRYINPYTSVLSTFGHAPHSSIL